MADYDFGAVEDGRIGEEAEHGEVDGHVGADILEQQRRARHGILDGDHGRQRLVVDHHEFRCVFALVLLLGHDHNDLFADETHLARGEQWLGHGGVEQRHVGGDGRQRDVVSGEHRDDAGGTLGLGNVDAHDPGVGHG